MQIVNRDSSYLGIAGIFELPDWQLFLVTMHGVSGRQIGRLDLSATHSCFFLL